MKLPYNIPGSITDLNGISDIRETLTIDNIIFVIKNNGLYYRDDKNIDRLICSPVVEVVANTTDDNSNNWGKILKWQDPNGKIHKQAMPFLHDDGANIRKSLANGGVSISSAVKARQNLNVYLQGKQVEKLARCVCQTGWNHNAYVTQDSVIGASDLGSNIDLIFQNESCPPEILSKNGTLEEWKATIATNAADNSRLVLAISAAFAAPLLRLLNVEGGGIHFYGQSSTGKSTALNIAASVWGSRSFKQTWRSTSNGLEATAQTYNDNILPLDEIKECDANTIGETIYMLGNGKGKNRANKNAEARKSKEWRILFISAGETRLADLMLDTGKKIYDGQSIRLADIDADAGKGMGMFENIHDFQSPSSLAEYLNKKSEENYGHAGLQFLKHLTASLHECIDKATSIITDFEKQKEIAEGDGLIKRVAKRFAVIAAAGELATSFELTTWSEGQAIFAAYLCFCNWFENYNGKEHIEHKIVSELRSFIETHAQSRFCDYKNNDTRIPNRAGFKEVVGENTIYYFLPTAFNNEIAKKVELKPKKVVEILVNLNIIKKQGDKDQISKNFNGETQRCYEIDGKALIDYNL